MTKVICKLEEKGGFLILNLVPEMLVERRAESWRKEWYGVEVGIAGHNGKALGARPRVSQSLAQLVWLRG